MANGKAALARVGTESDEPQPMAEVSGDILQSGKAIQKAGTPFVTAITVQRPRDLDKIVAAIDREAEYAGKTFWYSWVDKKGNRIQGPTIGLANSLAREWMNNAVTSDVVDVDDAFYIKARFIDLERGSQMERVFRQNKGGVAGQFDPERKQDIALQIGQSKAIRNVIVNCVPRWLVQRGMDKAKEAVAKKIDPAKLDEHKKNCATFFKKYGITSEQLVAKAGRPMAEWTTGDIADFQADASALQSGEVSIRELFPPMDAAPQAGPVTMDAAMSGTVKTPLAPPAAPVNEDSEPSPEEQEAIRQREIAEAKEQTVPAKAAAPAPAKRNSLF